MCGGCKLSKPTLITDVGGDTIMASLYFYKQNDQEYGPVDTATLKELAKTGSLHPDALIRKDGDSVWRPASEAASRFNTPLPPEAKSPGRGNEQTAAVSGDADRQPSSNVSTAAASVVMAFAIAFCLHALQWLFGWGWGSLWGFVSSVVILSLGIIPWMHIHEGQKSSAARFGAQVGAVLGIGYGWLSGGLLSGLVFCTSAGTWAAWVAERKGLTTKVAQLGVVASALLCLQAFGLLLPTGTGSYHSSASAQDWYSEGWDDGEGEALELICKCKDPLTGRIRDENIWDAVRQTLSVSAQTYLQTARDAAEEKTNYTGNDAKERENLSYNSEYSRGVADGYLSAAGRYIQ